MLTAAQGTEWCQCEENSEKISRVCTSATQILQTVSYSVVKLANT